MSEHLVALRCETIVRTADGMQRAYINLPVDRTLWESQSEEFREDCRRKAREELRHSIAKKTGTLPKEEDTRDLPVWVEYPDRCMVEFLGGPADGQQLLFRQPWPPAAIVAPNPVGLEVLLDPIEIFDPKGVLHYSPALDQHGFQRRARDGAWLYVQP
ncbi:hypothetical protein ACFV0R_19000 [Streptomyces sp. NPDC059578]|uniref:hypothetical protein n=1 Tax=Streptomyces sp. NPDC059578 TaxID=3346874 RepID=UPI003696E747